MGVTPLLFTTFGVWSDFGYGDMVNVHMRLLIKVNDQTNCLRPTAKASSGFEVGRSEMQMVIGTKSQG